KIKDIEEELPHDIKLAYLPHLSLVRLRLSGRSENKKSKELKADIDAIFLKIQNLLGDTWFEGDHNMSAILGNMLRTQKMTVGTIESCSGGNVAHNLTIIPGSSAYFIGGMVTYANEQK